MLKSDACWLYEEKSSKEDEAALNSEQVTCFALLFLSFHFCFIIIL